MLSIFPDLYTYSEVAPFLLRVAVGLIFISFAYSKLVSERDERMMFFQNIGLRPARFFWGAVSALELIGGVFLVIGFLVQPTAAVLGVIALASAGIKMRHPELLQNRTEHFLLLFAVLVSLMFLGPGFWAIDLPL